MAGFALYVLVRRCGGGSNGMGSVLELIMEGDTMLKLHNGDKQMLPPHFWLCSIPFPNVERICVGKA